MRVELIFIKAGSYFSSVKKKLVRLMNLWCHTFSPFNCCAKLIHQVFLFFFTKFRARAYEKAQFKTFFHKKKFFASYFRLFWYRQIHTLTFNIFLSRKKNLIKKILKIRAYFK